MQMGRFANLPDYIQGVTYGIWEGRDIASLHKAYGKTMVARSTLEVMVGAAEVIDDTLASQAAFPDRQVFGDEVIWSGTEADGCLSSHRSMIIGTHTGHGVFVPPTGKVVAARCIADCYVKDDVIDAEWLCYDMADMVQQLGHTPESCARASIAREGGPEKARHPFAPVIALSTSGTRAAGPAGAFPMPRRSGYNFAPLSRTQPSASTIRSGVPTQASRTAPRSAGR
jgi:hypothetical protein